MPLFEVAVNLPDKPNQKRGAPVGYFPAKGRYIQPAEMLTWINTGTEPVWGGVRPSRQRSLRKLVLRNRYWLDPALNHLDAAKERYTADRRSDFTPWDALPPEHQQQKLDEISDMVRDATAWKTKAVTDGVHTRWGFQDLRVFGIAIMNVPLTLIEDMMTPDSDLDVPAPYPQRHRRFKSSYQIDLSALSAQSIADWDDPAKHVLPASLDPAWNDADAWDDTKVSRFTQPRQNERGEIIPGDST